MTSFAFTTFVMDFTESPEGDHKEVSKGGLEGPYDSQKGRQRGHPGAQRRLGGGEKSFTSAQAMTTRKGFQV